MARNLQLSLFLLIFNCVHALAKVNTDGMSSTHCKNMLLIAYRLVHKLKQGLVLCCITFGLMLVTLQRDARIDSDSTLVFLCIGFLHLIAKISLS